MPIPGVGFQEVVIILIAALMIFGPAKLPEIMGQAGKALRDFRKMSGNLQGEFEKNLNEAAGTDVRKTLSSEIAGLKNEVQSATAGINGKPAAKTSTARPVTASTKTATTTAAKAVTTTGAAKKATPSTGSATTAPASAAKLPAAAPADPVSDEIEFVPVRTTSRRGTTAAPGRSATTTSARPAAAPAASGGSTAVATRPAPRSTPATPEADLTDPFARARSRRQAAGYQR